MHSNRSSQNGISLVEVMVALLVSGIVMAVLTNVIAGSSRSTGQTKASVQSSTSTYRVATLFPIDVSTAGFSNGESTELPVRRGVAGCGNETAKVRIINQNPATSVRTVISYHQKSTGTGTILERRTCSGSSVSAARTQPSYSTSTVAKDLSTAAVLVTCPEDSTPPPTSTTTEAPPPADSSCSNVTISATTLTGRTITASGEVQTSAEITATGVETPLRAPVSGQCTLRPKFEAYYDSFGGGVVNQNKLHTYQQGGWVGIVNWAYGHNDSYIAFDLRGTCAGYDPLQGIKGTEPWKTLPGSRNLTNISLKLPFSHTVDTGGWPIPTPRYETDHKIAGIPNSWALGNTMTLSPGNIPAEDTSQPNHTFSGPSAGQTAVITNGNWPYLAVKTVAAYTDTSQYPIVAFRFYPSTVSDVYSQHHEWRAWGDTSHGSPPLGPELIIEWGPNP